MDQWCQLRNDQRSHPIDRMLVQPFLRLPDLEALAAKSLSNDD